MAMYKTHFLIKGFAPGVADYDYITTMQNYIKKPRVCFIANKQTRIHEYLSDNLKCHSGMVIFQRRDVIVTNGELCLCIDLVTRKQKL